MKKKITEKDLLPGFRLDNSLNKYDNQILMPNKVEHAKKMLAKTGLPKEIEEELKKKKNK